MNGVSYYFFTLLSEYFKSLTCNNVAFLRYKVLSLLTRNVIMHKELIDAFSVNNWISAYPKQKTLVQKLYYFKMFLLEQLL